MGDAAASPDGVAAMQTLPALMRKLDAVGNRPWGWAQWLLKKAVAMPYDPDSQKDIQAYVRKYADQHLLTQQVGVHVIALSAAWLGCARTAGAQGGLQSPDHGQLASLLQQEERRYKQLTAGSCMCATGSYMHMPALSGLHPTSWRYEHSVQCLDVR